MTVEMAPVKAPRRRPEPGLGPRLQALWDWAFRPRLRQAWGGPFNGQANRQQIFRQLVARLPLSAIVETGAYRGTTTRFLAEVSGLPVFTVDAHPRYYHYARLRFRRHPLITVEEGDSRRFLERLAGDRTVSRERVFFYLDAHWQEDLPLYEELQIICRAWTDPVVMVDDFRVPGDAGYTYDNYGDGRELRLAYLEPLVPDRLQAFFPALPSDRETGARRGSVVLATAPVAADLEGLESLRPWDGEGETP